MSACLEGQEPWFIDGDGGTTTGNSAAQSCQAALPGFNGQSFNFAAIREMDGLCILGNDGNWEFKFGMPVQVCEVSPENPFLSVPSLLQMLLVCAVVFIFVRGFDSGNKL